jgi:uncharacterized protein (TIRG00374 family)
LCVAFLIHGIDTRKAFVGFREADARWLMLGAAITALSLVAGTMCWGLLVRSSRRVSWPTLGVWYAEGVAAAQLLPAGIGGDVTKGFQVSRAAGTPSALACLAGCRVVGAFAMACFGLAAAILLRPALGSGVLGGAALFAAAIAVGGILALNAERVVVRLGGGAGGRRTRLALRLRPFAAALSGFGKHSGLVGRILLVGFAGWALQLCALTIFARSIGVNVSWQVVAVAMPLTLLSTWLPVTANGIGIKEGVLVGVLVANGVDATHAATLSLLVDLQMMPFAVIGLAVWLLPARRLAREARLNNPDFVSEQLGDRMVRQPARNLA